MHILLCLLMAMMINAKDQVISCLDNNNEPVDWYVLSLAEFFRKALLTNSISLQVLHIQNARRVSVRIHRFK